LLCVYFITVRKLLRRTFEIPHAHEILEERICLTQQRHAVVDADRIAHDVKEETAVQRIWRRGIRRRSSGSRKDKLIHALIGLLKGIEAVCAVTVKLRPRLFREV